MTASFARASRQIARRLADVFAAEVTVTDARGSAVACHRGAGAPPDGMARRVLQISCGVRGYEGGCIVVGLCEDNPAPEHIIREFIDLLVHDISLTEAHRPEQDLRNAFVLGLLRGESSLDADTIRYADTLGMDLTRPRAVVLIDAGEYILAGGDDSVTLSGRDRIRARSVIDSIVSFFRLPSDAICAYIGSGEIAVLKASSSQDLDPWTAGTDAAHQPGSWANLDALKRASRALLTRLSGDTNSTLTIGVGRYHGGRRALARSYRDARTALALGAMARGSGQVHCLDELGITALAGVADRQTQVELARHLLSPLDSDPELHRTLSAFFAANCMMAETASILTIHRNTLTYRLQKIAALTGLDPRRFDDAVQMRLAMAVCQLEPVS